jgi:transcriptional regulator with XRE-family HTH domain
MSLVNMTDRMIGEDAARNGIARHIALERFARAAGLSPGTLQNFLRGRLKYVERAEKAIIRGLERAVQRKIGELENELSALRAAGARVREPDILGAMAALEAARACLKGETP